MVRMAPYNAKPTQRRMPIRQVDAERVVASREPHGVARAEQQQQRGHLRGPAARLSGSAEQYQASERHHFDPDAASVRFSQGVVTSASGACIAHQARKRHANSCRALANANTNIGSAVVLKPVPAAQSASKAATGCVIPMGEGGHGKPGKSTKVNNFAGPTLQGTSVMRTSGSENRFQRSASLAAGKKAIESESRPKTRGTVSAEFMASHPDPAPARTNEQRYGAAPRAQKRCFTAPAAAAVVAPWDK